MLIRPILGTPLVLLGIAHVVVGHPGRTDSRGGHLDHRTGVYHFHGGESVSFAPVSPTAGAAMFSSPAPTPQHRIQPRMEARRDAREKPRQGPREIAKGSLQASSEQTRQDEYRTWHDKTGRFSVLAAFVSYANRAVRLKKAKKAEDEDMVVIDVPLESLSAADHEYLRAKWLKNGVKPPF